MSMSTCKGGHFAIILGKRGKVRDYYIKVRKIDIDRTGGDLSLALWYSAVKDYARRVKPDTHGFKRIASKVFEDDFGFDRKKAWRYNRKLAELGLIALDSAHRGGRTWVGLKIL